MLSGKYYRLVDWNCCEGLSSEFMLSSVPCDVNVFSNVQNNVVEIWYMFIWQI